MDQLLPSTYYHIFNHANGDEDLFREPENYRYFLQQYHKHIDKIADTYAYCQMPNHFHLLVRIKAKEAITSHLPGFENLAGVEVLNMTNNYSAEFVPLPNEKETNILLNFFRRADRNILFVTIFY